MPANRPACTCVTLWERHFRNAGQQVIPFCMNATHSAPCMYDHCPWILHPSPDTKWSLERCYSNSLAFFVPLFCRNLYQYVPKNERYMNFRGPRIMTEIQTMDPDIFALQVKAIQNVIAIASSAKRVSVLCFWLEMFFVKLAHLRILGSWKTTLWRPLGERDTGLRLWPDYWNWRQVRGRADNSLEKGFVPFRLVDMRHREKIPIGLSACSDQAEYTIGNKHSSFPRLTLASFFRYNLFSWQNFFFQDVFRKLYEEEHLFADLAMEDIQVPFSFSTQRNVHGLPGFIIILCL